jgi:hypothetical protein
LKKANELAAPNALKKVKERVGGAENKHTAISDVCSSEQSKESVSVKSRFTGLRDLAASADNHEKATPIVQMKKAERVVMKAAAGGEKFGKVKTRGVADPTRAQNQAQFSLLSAEQGLAPRDMSVAGKIISSTEDKTSWIWQLFHGKHLKYDNIVRDFIRSPYSGIFQQFEDDVTQETLAATEERGHHVIFSLKIDGKIYSEGAHVVHGSALKISRPSWRHALVRLLKRAGITS